MDSAEPGQLSLQVADSLTKTAQLSGHAQVGAADVAEKSLSHDGRSSLRPWHRARLQARWTACGDEMEKGQRGGLMAPEDFIRAAVRPKSAEDSWLTKAAALPPRAGRPALDSWRE